MTNKVGFIYTLEHINTKGELISKESVRNIIPTVGQDYIIGAAFLGTSQFTAFYLGLYGNSYTPVAGDTMTTLIASCGEISTYDGTARQGITFPAVDDGSITTTASPNEFTFPAGETVRGAFISTTPTNGGTGGLLASAVLFPSPKVMAAGEILRVPAGFGLISS